MPTMKPSERMKIPRQAMPERHAAERAVCFQEVNCGYPPDAAATEANRCLQCKDAKCIGGCPVGVNIPAFVEAIAANDLSAAADILLADNVLP